MGGGLAVIYSDPEEPETSWQDHNWWDFIVAREEEEEDRPGLNVPCCPPVSQRASLASAGLVEAAVLARPSQEAAGQARPGQASY